MFSRLILTPFVAGTLYYMYQIYQTGEFHMGFLPFFFIGVILYLFAPQIEWWWVNRNPPELHDKLRALLQQHNVFYQNLTVAEKKRFRNRMALYMEAMDYKQMGGGPEVVPEDIRGFIAVGAIQIGFGQKDYLMDTFEHLIIYPGAFPSPQFPKQLHNCEHFEEDGVIMFAAKSVIDSTRLSPRAYNTILHTYAQVFDHHFSDTDFPALTENIWQPLEAMSGMNKTFIQESVGLMDIDPRPVSVHHFFVFSKKFKELLPKVFDQYVQIFNINPLEAYEPVVDRSQIDVK